ncbi:MAG TPA: hypothetical protein DDW51_14745, partial [Cyanobacteria bacterium UBA11367]|nr:hypothetical protein [Cyanobacteria bacterium UBA11367]
MLKNIGIWKRVFRLRAIYYSIFLGLLSLLVVTKVFPLTAQDIPVNVKLPILDSREEFWQVNRESPLMSSYWLSQQQPITTHQQLEEGRILYQTGRFAEAATLWQKAATDYEEKQDRNYQSLSLSYLSLAYQELGQWQKAETAINQSLSLITHNQPPTTKNQLIFAQILNTQASLQLATGKAE